MRKIFVLTVAVLLVSGIYYTASGRSFYSNKDQGSVVSPVAPGTNKTPSNNTANQDYEVIGFLPFWMLDNTDYLRYELLTELVYFGLHVDAQGEFVTIDEEGSAEKGWSNWQESEKVEDVLQKARDSKIRTSLAIVMQDNSTIDEFLNCRACWSTLAKNTLAQMEEKNVRNLNIDYEYSGLTPEQIRSTYSVFVDFMVQQVHNQFPGSIVTVDTHANAAQRPRLHDIKKLAQSADRLFIMAYDFHQLSDDQTGPLAPIGGAPTKYRYDLTTMLEDYLQFAPAEKLQMGVAYYGHHWITEDNKLGSFRIPGDDLIGYSKIVYYKYCNDNPDLTNAEYFWDEEAQAPWLTYFDEEGGVQRQCHYENERSLTAKYELAKKYHLAGVGIWALGYDGDRPELWNLLEKEL